MRCPAGHRKHFFELGWEVEDEQIGHVGPQPLDVLPGADQQQRVADAQWCVQKPALDRDAAVA